jgi:endonuclease G
MIDIGLKKIAGHFTDELVLRVHVHEKLSGYALESAVDAGATRRVPPEIRGVKTDVIEGVYRTHVWWGWGSWNWQAPNPRAQCADPLKGGLSISSERSRGYGTLGGVVRDRETGEEMILGAWHVLGGDWGARPGQRIYQPGRGDGGGPSDTVATLTRDAMADSLDAAVAKLTGSRRLTAEQLDLGSVRGVRHAYLGMHVVKSGRTTEITEGRVTGINGARKMTYRGLTRRIVNVIAIDPWESGEVSAGGDSGAWWLDRETNQVVGLHFAGSDHPERALAVDMPSVLTSLGVDLIT